MTQEPISLVGAGGHSKDCIDVIEQEGCFEVKGLVGLHKEIGASIFDYPLLGSDEDLSKLLNDCANSLIFFGQIKTSEPRIRVFNFLQQNNFVLPTILSPYAYISPHATLDTGTIVMHGAIVNLGAKVGKNCIINSQSLVDHDVVIQDHCHIATAATINSGLHIGTGTFIGSNSSVKQGVTIGDHCVLDMGRQVRANYETGICML